MPIALLGLLSACDPNIYSTGSSAPQTQTRTTPAELARRGNHTAAARAYRNLAVNASGIQRDKYYLEAADQWFLAQRYEDAQDQLYSIQGVLDSESEVRKILLQSSVALKLDQPALAVRTIERLNPQDSANIARPYYALRGKALFALGRMVAGTEDFVKREDYLRSPSELENNRARLWGELIEITTAGYRAADDEDATQNKEAISWIELAESIADARSVGAQQNAIDAWREAYPNNPAFTYALRDLPKIAERPRNASANFDDVQSIGVLIPMSGRLGRAGEIIKQGIMAANQANGSQYELSFYDSGADVLGAYSQAVNAGADAIIGPLDKNNINALSSLSRHYEYC